MIKYLLLLTVLIETGCAAVYPLPLSRNENEPNETVLTAVESVVATAWHDKCDFANGTLEGIITDLKKDFTPPFQSVFPQMIPAVFPSGRIYYVRENQLICARFNTGEKRWSVPVESFLVQVAEENEITVAYLMKETSVFLRAYDSANGSIVWQKNDAPARSFIKSTNSRLYVYNHYILRSYDMTNGELLWEKIFPEYTIIIRDVYVNGYTVLANVFDTRSNSEDTLCLDFFDKSTKWTPHMGECIHSDIAGVYVLRSNIKLVNLRNFETGKLDAYYYLPNFDGRFISIEDDIAYYSARTSEFNTPPPVVTKDTVKIPATEVLENREIIAYNFKANRNEWTCKFEDTEGLSTITSHRKAILVLSGPVFIGLNDWAYSRLTAISKETGDILFTADFPKGIVKATAAGNFVFAYSRYGWVYSYEWHLK